MNEQDPLAQLRDIRTPDPAGWWPPAPGWWILALLVLAALAAGVWLLYQRRAKNAYRRSAREELESAWKSLQQDGDRESYVHSLSQILRRTALVAYPPPLINALHGRAWLEFLDETSDDAESTAFSQGPGRDLATLPYRPVSQDKDLEPLHHVVMQWLKGHGTLKAAKAQEMRRAAV